MTWLIIIIIVIVVVFLISLMSGESVGDATGAAIGAGGGCIFVLVQIFLVGLSIIFVLWLFGALFG